MVQERQDLMGLGKEECENARTLRSALPRNCLSGSEENSSHIFIGPPGGGRFTELAADDHSQKLYPYWSPDGKWICYGSYGYTKTRPGGDIWEADVSELLSGGKMQ